MSLYGNQEKKQNSSIASVKKIAESTAMAVVMADILKLNTDGSNAALPTSDPASAGALWSNAGIVTVSAG